MKNRALFGLGAALLTVGLVGSAAPAGAGTTATAPLPLAVQYLRTHGYLPIHGAADLARSKAYAARWAAAHGAGSVAPTTAAAPIVGASWQGLNDPTLTPADPNGAIGPNSYVEIINEMLGIYQRNGTLITSATLHALTGDNNFLADPMVLWDPVTQRFYYNVWDVALQTMQWGFSKDANPTTIPGSFCKYSASFGYNPSSDFPDYPKLGQTQQFLMIGANHYPSLSSLHADRSDLLWINKPQGSSPITTCPPASQFNSGKFTDLRNQDGTQAFTPVPAIQTDPSRFGFVVTSSDIECPDICGTGTVITVHTLRPNPANPAVPQLTPGHSITVPSFQPPPDAPQKNTSNLLDTLDGRLEHAVSGLDPAVGVNVVWTGHAVLGGAGAQYRWYEIKPTPVTSPSIVQSGVVTSGSLYVFNGATSPDRTVNQSGRAHGDAMVTGFTTSASATFPASQMVSKIGAGAQSAMVLVKQSATFDADSSCAPTCRWGDYGGASSDPAASLAAAHGEVWLTNQWTNGSNQTWNWEAIP